jgi:hypothetical protein
MIANIINELTSISTSMRDGDGVNNLIADLQKMYQDSLSYVYKQINHTLLPDENKPIFT